MGLFDFLGDALGAASSYKAAKYAADANSAINAQNVALQQQTNAQQMMMFQDQRADTEKYFNVARDDTRFYHEDNIRAQERAAQNAIQWRVQDAIKAGIHPVYAMGNPGIATSPTGAFTSPQSAAAPPNLVAPQVQGAAGDASFVAHMGQAIGRAVSRMQTREERIIAAKQAQMAQIRDELSIENGSLQNDLIRSEIIRNLKPEYAGPPAPSVAAVSEFGSTRGRQGSVSIVPAENTAQAIGVPGRDAGIINEYGYARDHTGNIVVVRSHDAAERLEDDLFGGLSWNVRNSILPALRGIQPPSTREFPIPAGRGDRWQWDFTSQSFRPAFSKPRKGTQYRRRS